MGGAGILLPYRRPHPLPRLEVGEASQRETGGNGSASISHLHRGSMDSAHSVRRNEWKRRNILSLTARPIFLIKNLLSSNNNLAVLYGECWKLTVGFHPKRG